jgi:alanyl-tRNA synthetase
MQSNLVRQTFIDYFKKNGHTHVPSSPVIPIADPTLLFINAGMNQFKDIFLGNETRPYNRACSSQKCIRAGGKHNDLDNVGYTARHHTFFEMLGNFSFGDYFKEEAILFCWELMTKVFELPSNKLWATIYRDDDEAGKLWKKISGLPESRIIRLGEKDNFWSMGDTGPCGPCSEVLIDQGEHMKCGPTCGIGSCDCDRYLELWNLVFMQFNRSEDGSQTSLPRPSIDTGMGLERITAILEGVQSNYDTDLLHTLIEKVGQISGRKYSKNIEGSPFRVIADHIRCLTFALSDGAYPSNEGRGYVLRKILRRAFRFGLKLDLDKPFLYTLVPTVCEIMGNAYPEIIQKQDYVQGIIKNEETRFQDTLSEGMKRIEETVVAIKKSGSNVISGDQAFRLYDTYGLPLDIIEDVATDERFTIDMPQFHSLMQKQREQARSAQKDTALGQNIDLYEVIRKHIGKDVVFTGYETETAQTKIAAIVKDGVMADTASEGQAVDIVLLETPFYAESGGQVSDIGTIHSESVSIDVCDTVTPLTGLIIHKCTIRSGKVKQGDTVTAEIDHERRSDIRRHHSATHLLHHSLRAVLGDHVKQSGSLVTPERLRFDFTHFKGITTEEADRITLMINNLIRSNLIQHTDIMNIDQARKAGAMALFSEKYADTVRVVSFGNVSKELCGGTHVKATGEIGFFTIVNEGSVATGIRRLEAVCSHAADNYFIEREHIIKELSSILRSAPADFSEKITKLLDEKKTLEKRIQELETQLSKANVDDMLKDIQLINNVPALIKNCGDTNAKALRAIGDELKSKIASGIIALASQNNNALVFLVMITKDLVQKGYNAGNLVKGMAQIAGGNGGGRPDMAQAGAPDISKLDDAIQTLYSTLNKQDK